LGWDYILRKKLKKQLGADNIFLDLAAEDKNSLIQEMIDRLQASGMIKDREGALQAVLEREEKMSTGMNNGVAIPHGKTDSVNKLIVAVGLQRSGIDFSCADGKPAQIFIMTISPASRSGPHIQFLAEVSKILREEASRQRLLSARSIQDVIQVFTL
jgi:fructose-specific phosphotransferase system IIA component